MNALVGWALAFAAFIVGWFSYGWPGVFLAFTVIVFWLLLQFSRSLRVLRVAGANPVGEVASAVMLNAKLHRGMSLPQVLALTRSLGRKQGEDAAAGRETWAWVDAHGDRVDIELVHGRLERWSLQRSPTAAEAPPAA